MVPPELLTYLREQLQAGHSEEILRTALAGSGWQETDIQAAFAQVAPGTSAPHQNHRWLRPVIFLVIIAAVAGAGFVLYKRGSARPVATPEEPNPSATPVTPSPLSTTPDGTVSLSGQVSLSETICTGMSVLSADGQSKVSATGSVTLPTSDTGAQIQFVNDAAGQVCLSAITLPRSGTVLFDAESTAQAQIFLTPGILDTIPANAQQRLLAIQAAPSYPAFVAYLRTQLAIHPLSDVTRTDTYGKLLSPCISEITQSLMK